MKPSSFAVMGPNATFRQSAFDPAEYFNPTNSRPPFFQAFDASFFDVLGDSPSIHQVAENATWAFAHEGPVYIPYTDEVIFASRAGGDLSFSDWDNNNQMCKISMSDIESALEAAGDEQISVPYTVVSFRVRSAFPLPDHISHASLISMRIFRWRMAALDRSKAKCLLLLRDVDIFLLPSFALIPIRHSRRQLYSTTILVYSVLAGRLLTKSGTLRASVQLAE